MEAKALADSLVEAGILTLSIHSDSEYRYMLHQTGYTAQHIVTDWRVAGKCLESMWVDVCHNNEEFLDFVNRQINGKSIHELPRAIVEAFCEAQDDDL